MNKTAFSRTERKEVARLLTDTDTHALTLLTICLSKYPDYFELDPLEVYARLNEDFNVTLPDAAENRLQAITVAMTTDAFETDPSAYDAIVKALTDGDPDLDHGDMDISSDEMLWAEYEVRVATNREPDFSPAVAALRAMITQVEGDEEELADVAETLEEQRVKLLKDLQDAGFEVERVPEL